MQLLQNDVRVRQQSLHIPSCCRFFILYKGAKNIVKLPITTSLWASAAAGGGAAFLGLVLGIPLLNKQLKVWDSTM